MYLSNKSKKGATNFFLSWQFLVFKLFVLALLSLYLTHPTGSLQGQVAFEQEGFNLYSSSTEGLTISAVAIGPRGEEVQNRGGWSEPSERGVWVKPDGTFRLDQLPQGEYQVRIRANGFNTEYVNDIYVDDGKVTSLPTPVRMSILTPSVSVASNIRVYTTKETPTFWTSVSAGKHVKVSVYKENILRELHSDHPDRLDINYYGMSIKNSSGVEGNFEKEKPVQVFERDIVNGWSDESRADFAFSKPLPQGDYVLCADATALDGDSHSYSCHLFSVSDLGLIVKKAPETILVRAIDLNTLKPVPGAHIEVMERDSVSTILSKGTTGKDGIVKLKPSNLDSEEQHDLVVGSFGLNCAYDGINYYQNNDDQYRTYMYTDRPVYRLGQTVYFKGILRQLSINGLSNPGKGRDMSVQVQDPDNQTLDTINCATNDHGTFYGSVKVPLTQKTGYFQMMITLPNGKTTYSGFTIEQYRKPEFLVEVKPTVPRVVAGTKGEMHIKATYFFGAPVANARIKYSIYSSSDYGLRYQLMPRPSYYRFFDDWDDDDTTNWYTNNSGGDSEKSDYVQTDATGEAVVKFDTQPIVRDQSQPEPYDSNYCDRNYRVEAEVTDLTRMTVTGSGSMLVTPADFTLFVDPSSYVAKVGESLSAQVSAVDYNGKPVANQPLTLKLVRYPYDRAKSQYRGSEVKATTQAVTDDKGVCKVNFATNDEWPCDTFYIIAEGNDKTGHTAYGAQSIWIANDKQPYFAWNDNQAAKIPLEIKFDKPIYKPGEHARVMISGPVRGTEGVEALVSVEGQKLHNYRVVPLTATATLVDVEIKQEYIPNVFLSVVMVGKKHQLYTVEKMIKVSPEQNFLNLVVTTDKDTYKPGESVKYTIKATHLDGRPAPNTEVSLGVVDESIYSIMPDSTENIQKFFFKKLPNMVKTSSSFPEEYSGGPDKAEPHVRKDFKDTAAWIPELKTNKDGIALASVKLPDNLTTWRATVRGIDTANDVGSTIQKIITTQDLIVRLGLPRFFTQDDQSTVAAVVHNYTKIPQSVKLTFTPSTQLTTTLPLVQTIKVEPDKAARFDWPITAVSAGNCTIHLKAVGQTASDAIEKQLSIRPLGVPAFSVKAGLITDANGSVELPVGLSADTAPGTAKYQVSLASSSIGPVLGNFDALIEYPYGCTEQTLSRMVPSIVAFKMHKQLGLPLAKDMETRFDNVNAEALSKLETYRHGDGGWGWWESDKSQPYLTALVMDGVTLLNSTGRYADHHDEWLDGGAKYLNTAITTLEKQMSDPHLINDWWLLNEYRTDMAFALYAIGLRQKLPDKETTWMVKNYKLLTPEALSYLTMALKKAGRDADAQLVYNQLIYLANTNPDYTDWDHSRAMCKRLAAKGIFDEYSYRFTGVESTALALRAVLAMEPNNTKRIEAIKGWLLLQRDKDGWDNTKTTAEVFEALVEEELIAKSKWPTNFTADADLGTKLLKEYVFNPTNTYEPERTFNVSFLPNKQTLTIKKNGTGRLYYTSLLTCFRKLKPGDNLNDKGFPQGLRLTRTFYHVVAGPMKSDGGIHFRTVPITDGKLKAGETIMMKVQVESPVRIPYVKLEAALPSGGEVVQDSGPSDSSMENADGSGPTMEGDWQPAWWQHQDVLDDRIVFFGTELPSGKSEFHTLLRMEIPGKLNVDPVDIEGMYTKKVRGYSGIDALTVTE